MSKPINDVSKKDAIELQTVSSSPDDKPNVRKAKPGKKRVHHRLGYHKRRAQGIFSRELNTNVTSKTKSAHESVVKSVGPVLDALLKLGHTGDVADEARQRSRKGKEKMECPSALEQLRTALTELSQDRNKYIRKVSWDLGLPGDFLAARLTPLHLPLVEELKGLSRKEVASILEGIEKATAGDEQLSRDLSDILTTIKETFEYASSFQARRTYDVRDALDALRCLGEHPEEATTDSVKELCAQLGGTWKRSRGQPPHQERLDALETELQGLDLRQLLDVSKGINAVANSLGKGDKQDRDTLRAAGKAVRASIHSNELVSKLAAEQKKSLFPLVKHMCATAPDTDVDLGKDCDELLRKAGDLLRACGFLAFEEWKYGLFQDAIARLLPKEVVDEDEDEFLFIDGPTRAHVVDRIEAEIRAHPDGKCDRFLGQVVSLLERFPTSELDKLYEGELPFPLEEAEANERNAHTLQGQHLLLNYLIERTVLIRS